MRKITDHIVEGDSANHQIEIVVTDEPGAGGANHCYQIEHTTPGRKSGDGPREFVHPLVTLHFQNGPILEAGVNGVTHEALLAIIIDRLSSFQKGPFASEFNERSLHYCRLALNEMQARTKERISRGVEGTHQK
jgi:hypothetical protein